MNFVDVNDKLSDIAMELGQGNEMDRRLAVIILQALGSYIGGDMDALNEAAERAAEQAEKQVKKYQSELNARWN